ncbi:MAG: GNAT family N-acetyltransferase [Puniceicoccaceae bacterium]|nr:MAG: GNAT family N-acetyltransferase [Puniceicoccaceae bacterium]
MPTTPPLVLRSATEADLPTILALIREIADYEKLSHEVVADAATLRSALFGKEPSARVVLAEWEGEVAGYAVWFHNFSTFLGRRGLYLEDLFVRPAFRRRGIGRALLQHLARKAVRTGCGRMEWAVLDWNRPAWDFYRSLGAKPLEEWRIFRLAGDDLERFGQTA